MAIQRRDADSAVDDAQRRPHVTVLVQVAVRFQSGRRLVRRQVRQPGEIVMPIALAVCQAECGGGRQILLQRDNRQVGQIFRRLEQLAAGGGLPGSLGVGAGYKLTH